MNEENHFNDYNKEDMFIYQSSNNIRKPSKEFIKTEENLNIERQNLKTESEYKNLNNDEYFDDSNSDHCFSETFSFVSLVN